MRIDSLAIARAAHEINRAYCASCGDDSQVPFDDAPEWQRTSAINGVAAIFEGRVTSPEQSHELWMQEKLDAGWTHGEVKDAEAKTHPALVPYAELPAEQRAKDALFFALVTALKAGQI